MRRTQRRSLVRGGLLAYALLAVACAESPPPDVTVAIVDVTVLPMSDDGVYEGQTVLLSGDRIAWIGPSARMRVPETVTRIDGRDRFVIPGLTDMHVHLLAEGDLTLYVANGVTTVRNMWGTPEVLGYRREVESGTRLGPAIYTAGPLTDGRPPIWPTSLVVDDPAVVDSVVSAQRDAGYDFIKVYNRLSSAVYDSIVAAGERYGLRIHGHVPDAVGLRGVLAAGQATVEHLGGYPEAVRPDDLPSDLYTPNLPRSEDMAQAVRIGERILAGEISLDRFIDDRKLEEIAAATREAGVWNVPTMVVTDKIFATTAEQDEALARPEAAYIHPSMIAFWRPSNDFRRSALSEDTFRALQAWRPRTRRIVGGLHAAGSRILLGTDAPNPYVFPGYAIHEELANLVDAGLTPYEALRAGTRDPAEFFGALAEFGTIEVGKRADLVLLQGNPLQDIANTARIDGVMVRGVWHSADALREALDRLAEEYRIASPD